LQGLTDQALDYDFHRFVSVRVVQVKQISHHFTSR
jgi:hypothetical protein